MRNVSKVLRAVDRTAGLVVPKRTLPIAWLRIPTAWAPENFSHMEDRKRVSGSGPRKPEVWTIRISWGVGGSDREKL